MKQSSPALSRLLLPVKDFSLFSHTLPLLQLISKSSNNQGLESIDLLHVVGGSFLSAHLNNIDLRAGHMVSSETITRLRKEHVESIVKPLLDQVQTLLDKSSIDVTAGIKLAEGDPVKKICEICDDEYYSTLILARRKKEEEGFFSGSVVNGILGRFVKPSIYLVGENGFPADCSPLARVLIGVDGSPNCMRAAAEAALLLGKNREEVEKVSLINVLDQACFFKEEIDCQEESERAYGYMDTVEKILTEQGVDADKIEATVLFGHPGEMLTRHAHDFDATLTYIGRRDRSKIAEVLLGSVCGDIIHQLRDRALVLVS